MGSDIYGQQKFYGSFLAVCWITVLARAYVRVRIVRSFGYDDSLMIASLALFTVIVGLALRMVAVGLGRHAVTVPAAHVQEIIKIFYCEEIVYFAATVLGKLSIAIMLLRLAQSRTHRFIILGTAAFYTACGIAFVVVASLQCSPINRYWDPSVAGSCMSRDVFANLMYTNATISLVTDGIFAILPTFLIWNAKMNRRTKISVGVVLGLGISTSGVNIARMTFIKGLVNKTDPSYDLYPISFTSILEVALGITSASLATLRPLLRIITIKLNSWSSFFSLSDGGPGFEDGSEHSLSAPQGKEEEPILRAPKADVQEWFVTCLASQQQAMEDNEHLLAMRKARPSAGNKGHKYHSSQDLDLPPFLTESPVEQV
ncbi:integral membrane protein [Phlyctema vagabunda]|uniref:Integral membrane protein n=1 Tax=Phlyctema vagabunda TaxID=108571 RepID=A0ABR4P3P7_9HELO